MRWPPTFTTKTNTNTHCVLTMQRGCNIHALTLNSLLVTDVGRVMYGRYGDHGEATGFGECF